MIKTSLITLVFVFVISIISAQTEGTFTDERNGKEYKTVTIGDQTWMAENLAYEVADGCWSYSLYLSNVDIYGYLYSWETAQNICPR